MIYLGLLILSFILTLLIRKIAIKKAFLDIPNARSSHDIPTPHGGGIAIVIAWFLGLFYLYNLNQIQNSLFFALCGGIFISCISFLDDIFEIKPKYRLLTQAIVSFWGLYYLGGLERIDFGIFVLENKILTNAFAFLMILWFINLYNFLDGIDGYAGSEAIFLGLGGFILFENDIFLVLICSVLGFLFLNWQKAKIFMGDVGSTILGYNVAIFAIYFQNENFSILLWFMLFGVFFFDATITLFRRLKNKEKIQIAHKKHAYQRLNQAGFSHQKVVLFAMSVNVILFFFTYVSLKENNLLSFSFIICMIFLYIMVKLVDKKKEFYV